jgi:hypothetical protein
MCPLGPSVTLWFKPPKEHGICKVNSVLPLALHRDSLSSLWSHCGGPHATMSPAVQLHLWIIFRRQPTSPLSSGKQVLSWRKLAQRLHSLYQTLVSGSLGKGEPPVHLVIGTFVLRQPSTVPLPGVRLRAGTFLSAMVSSGSDARTQDCAWLTVNIFKLLFFQ